MPGLKQKTTALQKRISTAWKKFKIKHRIFRPKNRYDHLVLLGYNCEIAFQFFNMYRFLESGLFAWSYASSLHDTLHALQHPDLIGTNGFIFTDPLWQCRNTQISFHGKNTQISLEQEEQELTQRLAYLKKKFTQICATAGQKLLFVVKVRTSPSAGNADDLPALYHTLKQITRSDFDLLVICEKDAVLPRLSYPHVFIRRVDHFAPENSVTNTLLAANEDWERIFSEFGPKRYLKHNKHFKFEKLL